MAKQVNLILIIAVFIVLFMILTSLMYSNGEGNSTPSVASIVSINAESIKLQNAIAELSAQIKANSALIPLSEVAGLRSTDSDNKIRIDPPSEHISDLIESSLVDVPVVRPAATESKPIISMKASKMYVDNHRILTLSEDDFLRIPLSEMMSWYGEADGGGSCADDFGNQLVNRWRDTKRSYCTPTSSSNNHATGNSIADISSSIDCYLVKQTRHAGGGDNICVLNDVSVNMGYYGNNQEMYSVIENYVGTKHFRQPYVPFQPGFIAANQCELQPELWIDKSMPGWNADWTTKSVKAHSNNQGNKDLQCSEWIDHPVLVMQRDTFANFFHDSEDFMNVFLTMAILKWNVGTTQIYLTDLYPEGPFWDIWGTVFGRGLRANNPSEYSEHTQPGNTHGKPPMTGWDLRNQFGRKNSNPNTNNRVCYKQLAVGIYGPAAPICVISWNTPCTHTALVRAYSDFIIRGMNLQLNTHYAQAQPSNKIIVTYMARRASAVWPEKKYCSDTESFFKCEYWKTWGIRSHGRMVKNDQEIMTALRSAFTKAEYGVEFVFQDVDYNLLSFEEQIKTDLETDIMIGPHGAGLMHNIFMRDRAVLIELFVDGSGANRHFHNLAHWYGRDYIGESMQNPIEASTVIHLVKRGYELLKKNMNTY